MSLKNRVGNFVKKVYDKLQEKSFLEESRMRKQDFTRSRKMSFCDTMIVVLNKTGRGLTAGIRAFFEAVQIENETYSNQAFSKGRMRIKWEAFRELFRMSVDDFYSEFKPEYYKGYRVSAIDGTKLNLPFHTETAEEFGIQKGTNDQIQALGSCLFDVVNKILIDADVMNIETSEKELAMQHLERLSKLEHNKELIIFDRGYPSAELIEFIENKQFKYLMRCSRSFVSPFKNLITSNDCVISYTFKKYKYQANFRVIQFTLSSGETECLITNIFDKDFLVDNFKELYHMRWCIETAYNDIKNKLELENYSGVTPLAIRQDFFATMFLRNLASFIIIENKEEIDRLHNSGENMHTYQANVNTVISIIKRDLINMLVVDSKFKRRKLWKKIVTEITRSVLPVRPNRSFLRKKKHACQKFPQNQKS